MQPDDHIDILALCLSYKKYFPEDQAEEEFITDTLAMRFPNKIRGKLEKYKSTWLAEHPGEVEVVSEQESAASPENTPSPPMGQSPSPVPETTTTLAAAITSTASPEPGKSDKSQFTRIFFTYFVEGNTKRIDPDTIRTIFEAPGIKSFVDIPTPNDRRARIVGIVFLRRVTLGRVQSELFEHFKITPCFKLAGEEKNAIMNAISDSNTIENVDDREAAEASKKEGAMLQRVMKLEKRLARTMERVKSLEELCYGYELEEEEKKNKKRKHTDN